MSSINRFIMLVLVLSLPLGASAQKKPATTTAAVLTVAVLDFDAKTAGDPELGKQVSEALVAMLAGEGTYQLVDRAALSRALQEQELGASGLVDAATAAKLGHVVGAKILITGKVFPLDKQTYVTAKIIGTETSLVEGVLVKADQTAEVGMIVERLSSKIIERIQAIGPKLVAGESDETDPLPGLIARLSSRTLPKLGVRIAEHHVTQAPAARIDPAVETEMRALLKQAGFTIIEGDDKELAKAGVEQVITGEAFSEFAARIGNLVSCSARVELKVLPLNGGEVLYTDRETARAADLSENIAGKSALQKGGRAIGIRLLEHFDKTLPKSPTSVPAGG